MIPFQIIAGGTLVLNATDGKPYEMRLGVYLYFHCRM